MAFLPRSSRAAAAALAVAAGLALSLTACGTSSSDEAGSTSGSSGSDLAPPVIIKDGKLTVCTGDSPPNIFYDENNELQGVEIDIAKALAEQTDLTLELGEYAFAGLIPALQAKQCDVIMGSLYIKPEREEVANFVPYLYSGTAVAVNTENPKRVTGFDESLCGTSIVAINGATGAVAAQEKSDECAADGDKAINITLVDEGTNALQQVLAGQADAFIDTSEIVNFYAKESDGELEMAGEPFGKIQIGAATLKSNTALGERLQSAFDTLVEDGTYADILAEWGAESNDITQSE